MHNECVMAWWFAWGGSVVENIYEENVGRKILRQLLIAISIKCFFMEKFFLPLWMDMENVIYVN